MSYHSRAYRKHFEGYTEIRNPETGKIIRVYTSKYYKSSLPDRKLKQRKLLYMAMLLLTVALWMAVSLSGLPGTVTVYGSAFTALALVPLFLTAVSVFSFCFAPRRMTICQYNDTSVRLKWSALAAGIILSLSGAGELVFVFQNLRSFIWQEFLGIAGFFGAAAMMFVLFVLENAVEYLRVSNEDSMLSEQEDATEITT